MSQSNIPADPAAERSTLAKAYEPKSVESHWYDVWEKAGYFKPAAKGEPYVIVIPPPNVTGSLHMGHALNQTLQDVITRYHRMRGEAALWVPGTDHGGIATQNVVEKMLLKEGVSRHSLGREKFLERMWAWRQQTGDTILMQSKRLGASLDLTRTRFTMDEQCSRAVRYAFVQLCNKKLLYRGKRLVNWCPRCGTALSDIEVEHRDAKGSLWNIRYQIVERRKAKRPSKKGPDVFERGYIVVATTRPETLLGDTGVAVNPKDKRYKELIGVKLRLPLTGREIPIVADDVVDKSFGSGAVKVTPAHDQTDFEIAERHKLPHITVIGFDGKMTADAGEAYKGLDRFEARKKVVDDLEAQGVLEKVEDYTVSLSVCYRCDQVIEPLESEQWFLSMADMAKKGRDANKKGKVKIVPESWEGPYQLWLRNLKDWCVSRQIWWGHRIPVWYCVKSVDGHPQRTDHAPMVSMETPTACAACGNRQLEQDPDVLDTWFSSALWPMSVFGWPDETPDLKRFYPTTTLVTGHEILYLWVARMIMFGLEFLGKVPYKWVLIHGIVRDKQGRKMSKSLGNVIDPLELIEEFGADAMRFSLAQSAAPGRDMQISKDNFIGARNFCNKVWNATRFAMMNLEGAERRSLDDVKADLDVADKWILHRFNETVTATSELLNRFDIDAAARGLYSFFWADFCDWYLELIKPRVDRQHYGDVAVTEGSTHAARAVLAVVLEGTVKLLHPFMPFITEELWSKIPKVSQAEHVIVAEWPKPDGNLAFPDAAREISALQEIVTKLRSIRSEMNIPPAQQIRVTARPSSPEAASFLEKYRIALRCLNTRVGELAVDASATRPAASAAAVVPGADLYVPLEGLIDFAKEKARLEKELSSLRQDSDRLSKKLANHEFVTNAPPEEVERVRARFEESKERIRHLEENVATLSR